MDEMNKAKKSKLPFIIGGAIVGVAVIAVALIVGGNKSDRINCKHDDPSKIVTVEAVAPTCKRTGLTDGTKCSSCGTMVVPQQILQKLDCIESDWIIDLESTRTEDGKKHTECTLCGKTIKQDVIPSGSKLLEYTLLDNNTYQVIGIGECQDKDVVIPSKYNGLSVTSIGDSAFVFCDSLTSVVIPDSVTSIGKWAFYGCRSLTSIDIPDSVTSIGESSFYACSSLASVAIPASVNYIVYSAFNECTKLKSVYITDIEAWCNISFDDYASNPMRYGADLYLNGELVTDLIIPDTITKINNYAFFGCASLTSIEIPDSVTSIGSNAFAYCDSLTSVLIGDSVTSIGSYAFRNCTSLTSIKYHGTKEQWDAISKGTDWDYNTGDYTITYNYTGE